MIEKIMYIYMPYRHQGQWATIAVGLSDQLPITMIIGLPFILATKSEMDHDEEVVHAKLFKAKWKLTLKTPFCKPPNAVRHIATQSPGTMRVFHASPNTVITDAMEEDEESRSSESSAESIGGQE
jgi:hypothetical protein